MYQFIGWVKCNLLHRYYWRGISDFERMGIKPQKTIHCLICDGPMKDEGEE